MGNKKKMSLLMYLETRIVDHDGQVDARRINAQEREQIDNWSKIGFVEFGRVCFDSVDEHGTMWVEFSDEAWAMAHAARKERGIKALASRNYTKTSELKTD